MRVRYQLAVSLDGFIGPPDGSVDWLEPYGADHMEAFWKEIGGLVMGRVTYELMHRLGAELFAEFPQVVLTTNPAYEVVAPAETCTEGPHAALDALGARMKGGDVWLFGGGKTAGAFLDAGLVDTVELTTIPVVLGAGEPLFAGVAGPVALDLVSSRPGPDGTLVTTYATRSSARSGS